MAVQNSFIKIKGSLGGLTFYEKDGKSLIKTSSGVSKERILTDPNFRRTRENMQEFGAAATVGKAFRNGFSGISSEVGTASIAGRVTGMMKRINKVGPGNRGERTFEILTNKQLLEGFEFQSKLPFRTVFYAPYAAPTLDANRSVVTWTVPDFNVQNYMQIPNGATHFRLGLHAAVLSDYAFDSANSEYQFVLEEENLRNASAFSAQLPVVGSVGADTTLSVDLGFTTPVPATAGVLVGIAVLFYQEINGLYYSLANNNALQIAIVG
jgi:hypothetical protein